MFSTGYELGDARGQEDEGDVLRHDQATGRMPAGPIEEEHGVGAAADTARDLDEVELHRLAVGVGIDPPVYVTCEKPSCLRILPIVRSW